MVRSISFWLIPTIETRSFFQQRIEQLAERYDAPVFTPHVTLYFGVFSAEIDLLDLMRRVTQPVKRIELQVDRLLYTDQFTKTLFIQFQPDPILSQLSEALQQQAIGSSGFSLNPHLSLIYKFLSPAEKQKLVAEINPPQTSVQFDQIWATLTSETVENRQDVESWQVLHTPKLGEQN